MNLIIGVLVGLMASEEAKDFQLPSYDKERIQISGSPTYIEEEKINSLEGRKFFAYDTKINNIPITYSVQYHLSAVGVFISSDF